MPQTAYKRGNGTSPSANVKQGLVLFLLEDGSLLPVCTALRKEYTGLPNRDETALPDVGQTVTVRFEVNTHTIISGALMFIGYFSGLVTNPKIT